MLVLGFTISDTTCCKLVITRRAHIKIAALEDERDEVPCMIMMMLHGFALHKVMNADGEQPKIQNPTSSVGTAFFAQWFIPSDLERSDFSVLHGFWI